MLAALVEQIDIHLPGITAAVPEVDDFVELWDEPAELTRSDNIWALQELVPPPPVAATNATAKRIYARLGYTRVCESRQYAFA